jgi:hypothetical protein
MKLNEIKQAKKPATFKKYSNFHKWNDDNGADYYETEIDGKLVGYLLDGRRNVIGMWYNSKKIGTISLDFAKGKPIDDAQDPVAYSDEDPHWPYN